VLAIVAHLLTPRDIPFSLKPLAQAIVAGVGDSGGEPLRMRRGKYAAMTYVHFAYLGQTAEVTFLLALILGAILRTPATGYPVLGVSTMLAALSSLWIYADRWRCIEMVASRACIGLANLSILYVPLIAFVYANLRGFKKLGRR
jgi:hypothetical protein